MSAAPATTRNSTASQRLVANPNPMIASPHTTAATATPMPWRGERFVQPLVAEKGNDPVSGGAVRGPGHFGAPKTPGVPGKKGHVQPLVAEKANDPIAGAA